MAWASVGTLGSSNDKVAGTSIALVTLATVNVPKQDTPQVKVDVNVPEERPRKVKVVRDNQGRVKGLEE